MPKRNDGFFDIFPDKDFDGDRDLCDYLFFHEEEDELLDDVLDSRSVRHPYDLFDAIQNDSDIDAEDDDFSLDDGDDDFPADDDPSDDDAWTEEDDLLGEIPIPVENRSDRSNRPSGEGKTPPRSGIAYRREEAIYHLSCTDPDSEWAEELTRRYQFIIDGTAVASHYLTVNGAYLYSQAVKEHFQLPFDIPEELDSVETYFGTLLRDLAEDNTRLAMEVWEWCLDTFQPYMEYAEYRDDLTHSVLLDLSDYVDTFPGCVVDRMVQNPRFTEKVILQCTDNIWSIDLLISLALKDGRTETARKIMDCAFANPGSDVHDKARFIENCIEECSNWDELETMERFRDHVFPIVFGESDVRIKNKIARWQSAMADYIEHMEHQEKYAYSRKNAWRAKYRGATLDPRRYGSEEEYLDEIRRRKYAWRDWTSARYGVDPANFETREEFNAALRIAAEKAHEEARRQRAADPEDTAQYRFCKVWLEEQGGPYYYYLVGELQLDVGDLVEVPFGQENTVRRARVVSVGECYGFAFPCHARLIKTVIRKIESQNA